MVACDGLAGASPEVQNHVLGASKQFGVDRSAAAVIGETRSPGSRTRRGATLASVGATRPGTQSACPTCQAAIISRRAGRCTAKARCAMSQVSAAMGAYRDGRRSPRTLRYFADDLATAGRRAGLSWRRGGLAVAGGEPRPCGASRGRESSPAMAPQPRDTVAADRAGGRCRNGKPQPPHLDGDRKRCIEGCTQLKLRSDDLFKALDGPSKLTRITLPGRPPAAAGGASRDLPEHGGAPRATVDPGHADRCSTNLRNGKIKVFSSESSGRYNLCSHATRPRSPAIRGGRACRAVGRKPANVAPRSFSAR